MTITDIPCFAAAPTFAAMALLTAASGSGGEDILCAAAHRASPLSGMAAMYLLMSAAHLAPWLKLLAGRERDLSFALPSTNKE
jgi:hypothetical protein